MGISYLNDDERSDGDPYSLFIFAINVDETKQKYTTKDQEVSRIDRNRPTNGINSTTTMQSIYRNRGGR
jgi:hypothetical protein